MAGRKLIVVLLFTVFTLVLASQATAAPEISWLSVQHRTWESGIEKGQLTFGLKDGTSGAAILEDRLESVTLYDPEGEEVMLGEPIFSGAYAELNAEYDGKTGIWNYGTGSFQQTADYAVQFDQEVMVGTYHVVAVFDGVPVDATFERTMEADLPVIPASSIKKKVDASGNLICTWAVSYELTKKNPSLATSVKVLIEAQKQGKSIGMLNYRVPTHLGRLFVPKAIVDTLKGFGSSHIITIHLRTNDNGTRSKSNERKLKL